MLRRLQNHIPLLRANHIRDLAGLQRKNLVLQLFVQRLALEITEIASIFRRRSVRILFRHIRKLRALVNLVEDIVSLGLRHSERSLHLSICRWIRLRSRSSRLYSRLWRNQNFAQPNLLGLPQFSFVRIVKFFLLILVHRQLRTDFLPDYALRNDLIPQILLEVSIGGTLRLGRLL